MLLQRLLESLDLGLGVTGWRSSLSLGGKVLLRFGDKQSRGPVPHLGVVEGLWELFDFPVPVSDWTLETPKCNNRTVGERYHENHNWHVLEFGKLIQEVSRICSIGPIMHPCEGILELLMDC